MDIVEFKQGSVPHSNALWVELPCHPSHDLNWSTQLGLAKGFKGNIVWYFNLSLEDPFFPLEDELRFSSLALALQQFTKEVWPLFQEQTLALSLYRGPIVDFVLYFQMLAHKLPDEAPIWLLFEIESQVPVYQALQMVFLDGFEHFTIALAGKQLPLEGYRWDQEKIVYQSLSSKIGAVFPADPKAIGRFDALLSHGPVRVVHEVYLAEQWEGLDRLLVLANSPTIQGNRLLKGFLATGGDVIYI